MEYDEIFPGFPVSRLTIEKIYCILSFLLFSCLKGRMTWIHDQPAETVCKDIVNTTYLFTLPFIKQHWSRSDLHLKYSRMKFTTFIFTKDNKFDFLVFHEI